MMPFARGRDGTLTPISSPPVEPSKIQRWTVALKGDPEDAISKFATYGMAAVNLVRSPSGGWAWPPNVSRFWVVHLSRAPIATPEKPIATSTAPFEPEYWARINFRYDAIPGAPAVDGWPEWIETIGSDDSHLVEVFPWTSQALAEPVPAEALEREWRTQYPRDLLPKIEDVLPHVEPLELPDAAQRYAQAAILAAVALGVLLIVRRS